MMKPNFAAAAADARAIEWRERERMRIYNRPMLEHEIVCREDFMCALARGDADEIGILFDYFSGAGYGHGAFIKLIRAAADRDGNSAWDALRDAAEQISKYRAEAR